MHKGVLSKETHETVVRFTPPLVIDKSILDQVVKALDEVLNELEFNS
jgi:ornithine--oxo-acid transaminase